MLTGLRFQKWNSSIQVTYHPTLSIEGDALGKVVGWFGNVDSQTEFGRTTKVTHRNQVKNVAPTI